MANKGNLQNNPTVGSSRHIRHSYLWSGLLLGVMTIIFLINGSAAWEVAFFLSLALFIGILLFGQGQSEATFKSKAVRFGGPAAVVFVILMVLTTRNPSFAFTVTLKMDKSNPPIREGTAQLDIGEQQLSAKIESG